VSEPLFYFVVRLGAKGQIRRSRKLLLYPVLAGEPSSEPWCPSPKVADSVKNQCFITENFYYWNFLFKNCYKYL